MIALAFFLGVLVGSGVTKFLSVRMIAQGLPLAMENAVREGLVRRFTLSDPPTVTELPPLTGIVTNRPAEYCVGRVTDVESLAMPSPLYEGNDASRAKMAWESVGLGMVSGIYVFVHDGDVRGSKVIP